MSNISCEILWPEDKNKEFLLWGFITGKLGYDPNLKNPVMIAVRGCKPFDKVTHEMVHYPVYDDSFIILNPDGSHPLIFPAATHSYQKNSKLSPDVDKDGVGDVGSIRPGKYIMKDLKAGKYPIFHILNLKGEDKIPCWRDFDHSGKISPEEMRKSEEVRTGSQVNTEGTYSTSVLWHCGHDAPSDSSHRSSISCFTSSWNYLLKASEIASKYNGKIELSLVDASTIIPYAEEFDKLFSDDSSWIT